MESTEQKWIIDTDPGCDDMMAIFYLIKKKNQNILAINLSEGNCLMPDVKTNIKKILKIINTKINCFVGCSKQILNDSGNAYDYHYGDGLGGIEEIINMNIDDYEDLIQDTPASVKLVELVNTYPNQINLLAVAPLTNLIAAYMLDNSIIKKFRNIVLMGGSYTASGNVLPTSEFNFAYDYGASNIFLKRFSNVLIIPWEPTANQYFDISILEKARDNLIDKGSEIDETVYSYIEKILAKFTTKRNGMQICDLYAIMCYFNSKIVTKFFFAKCTTVIDSHHMRGLFNIKNKTYVDLSFEDIMLNYYQKGLEYKEGYNILVEELDLEEIIKEFEIIIEK